MSYSNGIDMRVLVNGRPCKEYSHNGNRFIEAKHGTNYTVKVKNDNGYRVMAVISVDGLDVITGKPAEEANKGYIIDAYSYSEIKGYRVSDENAAAFVFSSKDKSYVAKTTGDARNSGVIGVRVFKEKVSVPIGVTTLATTHPWNPYTTTVWTGGYTLPSITTTGNPSIPFINTTGIGTCANNSVTYTFNGSTTGVNMISTTSGVDTQAFLNTFRGSGQAINHGNAFDAPISYKSFDTGTTWGKKLDDKVKKEFFDRGDVLTELVAFYASREALLGMGVDLQEDSRIAVSQAPQAFGSKYCQPPKGWQG